MHSSISMDYKGSKHIVMSKVQVQDTFQRVFGDENVPMHRGTGSNLGQGSGGGGGAASQKRAPYLTLANKQKSLTLKNS